MRTILILIFTFCISSIGFSQVKIASANAGKELTDSTSGMKIIGYKDGKYSFTYQNILSEKTDPCTVFFKNREEANLFVKDIKKAFLLKEGSVSKVNYGNSEIVLMPASTGSVFMRVQTKGEKPSAFAINRLTFEQINILR